MAEAATKLKAPRTWKEYQKLPDGERWEIIGGEPIPRSTHFAYEGAFDQAASPAYSHQRVLLALAVELSAFFKGKPCEVLLSPLDVQLSENDCVEPDLMVVCDRKQIKTAHVEGAPALVVEIVSPSSMQIDRIRKLRLYAEHGVREYWIVTPHPAMVEVLALDKGQYRVAGSYGREDRLASPLFPGLALPLQTIFDVPVEEEDAGSLSLREKRAAYRSKPTKKRASL